MISVIIPVYNKVTCIKKTIQSVLNQSYKNIEVLCVDDGSTDGTIEVIRSFEDSRIKLFSKKNGGVSSARNYGIEHATGEWFFFLDADDIIVPNALEILMCLYKATGLKICIGNIIIRGNESRYYCRAGNNIIVGDIFYEAAKNNCFPRTGNTLIHRDVIGEARFCQDYNKFEDLDFFSRILDRKKGVITQKTVFIYELDNNSLSKNNSYERDYRCFIDRKKLSYWSQIFHGQFLWNYDIIGVFKHSHKKMDILLLLILSFFSFFFRIIRYKFSKPVII